jgi:hypothetical protein
MFSDTQSTECDVRQNQRLSCLTCHNANSEEECQTKGKYVECPGPDVSLCVIFECGTSRPKTNSDNTLGRQRRPNEGQLGQILDKLGQFYIIIIRQINIYLTK